MTLDEAIAIAKESNENQCLDDRGRENYKQLAAWLEELKQYRLASPYKKPAYKLAKFEKDLLQSFLDTYAFKDVRPLTWMKEEGYFKGVDEDATIKDILADCEVTKED